MFLVIKKARYIIMLVVSALLLSTGAWAQEAATEEEPPPPQKKVIRHVILVTFDGVTEKDMQQAYTPNLNGLAASGVYAPGMDVLPPDSAYHLAAILSGADTGINVFTPGVRRLKTDTLPGIFKKYGRTALYFVNGKSKAKDFLAIERDSVKVGVISGSDTDVMDAALKEFEKNRPYFLGVVLSGAKSTPGNGVRYYKAVGGADGQLGRMLLKLKDLGVYDESLLIVTGSSSEKRAAQQNSSDYRQVLVPVIMKGPGLKTGTKLPPVRIIDVAPTTALLTGVALPEGSNGVVVWNSLMAGTGFVEENLLQKRVKDLSQEFVKSTGSIYQLQEEKRLVQMEKEQIRKEKQEIQDIIKSKDSKIRSLSGTIRVMQLTGMLLLILSGIGYVVEYKYLRKKFMMF
jgi:hypothetical protein